MGVFVFFTVPAFASAASLTTLQANTIIALLQGFGVSQPVLLQVEQALGVAPIATTTPVASTPPAPPHVPVVNSVYRASNTGYDFSYAPPQYSTNAFNFGIVGVTHGKAFTEDGLIGSDYSLAEYGRGAPPTLYMNLNAPYGSTVAGHVNSPQSCAVTTIGTSSEPTACAGYNYGYQAAQYAFAYATNAGITSPIWWLDIEEANSWSASTTVNDATIQGAIDYMNAQNTRVGIYSMPYMWNDIAGSTFVPTQTIGGQAVSIPLWFPIGITSIVGALNACTTKSPFIAGSPIWLVQYETSSTAIDQNTSC